MIFDTRRNIKTAGFLDEAIAALTLADERMAAIISRVGPCHLSMT